MHECWLGHIKRPSKALNKSYSHLTHRDFIETIIADNMRKVTFYLLICNDFGHTSGVQKFVIDREDNK